MAGYNRVIMIGNLTRDPEYKQLSSGQAVCRLGLASNRQFKNRQTGNLVQEVCYIDIDVWGAQAESCRQYLQKGRGVLVEGRLKFDTWEDPNGQNRNKHSIVADRIVFLGASADNVDTQQRNDAQTDEEPKQNVQGAVRSNDDASEPQSELEKELLDQIEQIKGRQAATAKPKKQAKEEVSTGEIDFKDEPPFKDELPF